MVVDRVVWVTVGTNTHGACYHTRQECFHGKHRVPTLESAAKQAALVICAQCAKTDGVGPKEAIRGE